MSEAGNRRAGAWPVGCSDRQDPEKEDRLLSAAALGTGGGDLESGGVEWPVGKKLNLFSFKLNK